MLPQSAFACLMRNGVFACQATVPEAVDVVKRLQLRVRSVAQQMKQAGRDVPPSVLTMNDDGRVGPTLAIGAQTVINALAHVMPPPAEFEPIVKVGVAAPDVIVQATAGLADEILAYIDRVLMMRPEVFAPTNIMTPAPKMPFPTKETLIYAGVGILTLGGMIALAWTADRKSKPSVERSKFLEPDEEDVEVEEIDETDYSTAIDVESIEVAHETEVEETADRAV